MGRSPFGQDRGVGVRVLVNGALGFAATNMRTKSDVRAIVDDAIKVAKASRRKTKITFAHEDAIEMNWSIPEQRKLADVPVEEKIAEIQSVDRDLMALGLKIPARYFQFSDNRIVKYFANSEGSKIQSYSPRLRVFYFLTVVQDGQVEQTYRNYGWSGGWEGIGEWDLRKRVIDEARSMQRTLAEGKKSPEGKMDLLAGPQVARDRGGHAHAQQRRGAGGELQRGGDRADGEHVRGAEGPHRRRAPGGRQVRRLHEELHGVEHRRQALQREVCGPRGVPRRERRSQAPRSEHDHRAHDARVLVRRRRGGEGPRLRGGLLRQIRSGPSARRKPRRAHDPTPERVPQVIRWKMYPPGSLRRRSASAVRMRSRTSSRTAPTRFGSRRTKPSSATGGASRPPPCSSSTTSGCSRATSRT